MVELVETTTVGTWHAGWWSRCTAGADDPERCNQGFTVAAAAVAAGADVSLWLTGEAAWFGVPGRAEDVRPRPRHPARGPAGRGAGRWPGDGVHAVRPAARHRRRPTCVGGVTIAGAPAFAEEILGDGVQALVY